MRVTYFVFGTFRPGSPMATAPSDGLQLSVRAQPPVYTFDLWRVSGAVASTKGHRPLLGLFVIPAIAVAAGIAAYLAVRAWGKRAAGGGSESLARARRPAESADPILAGASSAAKEAAGPRPPSARGGDES
jgi:hypothetical protein